ncbi:MAG TPA: calcium-binding protein, partial [Dongiaceae bacterium]|nr:calcium-binding protein [Dongiaceae bacterium]
NDVIDGGAGADVMVGGDGNDTYTVDNAADLVFEGSGGSSGSADLVNSSLSFTLGNSIENLTLTGAGDIDGTGNGSDNIINGSTGSNTLTGGNGDDTLDGGNDAVADILNGGNDDDTLIWHGSVDTYNGGDDTDTLDVSGVVGSLDFTVLADTTVTRIETIKLTGGSGTAITLDAGDVLDSDDDINPSGGTGGGNTYGGRPVLTVDGDAGSDSVTLSSGGSDTWFSASGAGGVPSGYALYVHVTGGSNPADNEDAYVLVKTGVTVTLN